MYFFSVLYLSEAFGLLFGLTLAISLYASFSIGLAIIIWKTKRKTGKKPNEEILEKFDKRYDWLKKKIIENGLVEMTASDMKNR